MADEFIEELIQFKQGEEADAININSNFELLRTKINTFKNQFNLLQDNFSTIHNDFDDLREDFAKVQADFVVISKEFTNIQNGFNNIDNRIETLEIAAEQAYYDILTLDENLNNLQSQIETLQIDISNKIDKSIADNTGTLLQSLAINSDASTVSITANSVSVENGTESQDVILIPVASSTVAGAMNAATYSAVQNNSEKLNAMENGSVAISGIAAIPAQADLTAAWLNATGNTTVFNDAKIWDIDNNCQWTYFSNEATWFKTNAGGEGSGVVISQWTNSSLGIAKGSELDGQVFAEANGTGSVNGWDPLKSSVATVESSLTAHINNALNPHDVTKTQVGLDNVKNIDTTIATNVYTSGGQSVEAALQNAGGGISTIPFAINSGVINQTTGKNATFVYSSLSLYQAGDFTFTNANGTFNSNPQVAPLDFVPASTTNYCVRAINSNEAILEAVGNILQPSDLLPTTAGTNDVIFTPTNKKAFKWNGTSWVEYQGVYAGTLVVSGGTTTLENVDFNQNGHNVNTQSPTRHLTPDYTKMVSIGTGVGSAGITYTAPSSGRFIADTYSITNAGSGITKVNGIQIRNQAVNAMASASYAISFAFDVVKGDVINCSSNTGNTGVIMTFIPFKVVAV